MHVIFKIFTWCLILKEISKFSFNPVWMNHWYKFWNCSQDFPSQIPSTDFLRFPLHCPHHHLLCRLQHPKVSRGASPSPLASEVLILFLSYAHHWQKTLKEISLFDILQQSAFNFWQVWAPNCICGPIISAFSSTPRFRTTAKWPSFTMEVTWCTWVDAWKLSKSKNLSSFVFVTFADMIYYYDKMTLSFTLGRCRTDTVGVQAKYDQTPSTWHISQQMDLVRLILPPLHDIYLS